MNTMNKATLITDIKTFRQKLDAILQEVKTESGLLKSATYTGEQPEEPGEVIAQLMLARRDLESSIMRLGMTLKALGNPNPYPNSKDPSNTVVDKTADGLTM